MTPTGPSPHLTWTELRCHDMIHTPYPLDWRPDGRIRDLALAFESLRQASGGRPITVLSGYRTPAYNAMIHGAPQSQHVFGRAVDLQTPGHLTLDAFWRIAQEVARLVPVVGAIGLYDWGVHLDVRPRQTDRWATWDLRAVKPVRV